MIFTIIYEKLQKSQVSSLKSQVSTNHTYQVLMELIP